MATVYYFEKNNFPRGENFCSCQDYFKLRRQKDHISVRNILKFDKTNRLGIDPIVIWNKFNTQWNAMHFCHREFLLE